MKIEIHSIESIEKLAKMPFVPHTSLISIGDTDTLSLDLQNKPKNILRLTFDDVTFDIIREMYEIPHTSNTSNEKISELLSKKGIHLFNEKQAKQIAEFVLKYKDETKILICQCHYGQSRSAGCAAAISEYFYGNGINIFADERYYPNKLVYHKVLKALQCDGDQKTPT